MVFLNRLSYFFFVVGPLIAVIGLIRAFQGKGFRIVLIGTALFVLAYVLGYISTGGTGLPESAGDVEMQKLIKATREHVRGSAHLQRQNYGEAISSFEESLRIKPDYGPAWEGLGLAYRFKGDMESSVRALQNAVIYPYPMSGQAYFWLGLNYEDAAEYTRAIEMYEKALEKIESDEGGLDKWVQTGLKVDLEGYREIERETKRRLDQLRSITDEASH